MYPARSLNQLVALVQVSPGKRKPSINTDTIYFISILQYISFYIETIIYYQAYITQRKVGVYCSSHK